jgi:hypothetical protein
MRPAPRHDLVRGKLVLSVCSDNLYTLVMSGDGRQVTTFDMKFVAI